MNRPPNAHLIAGHRVSRRTFVLAGAALALAACASDDAGDDAGDAATGDTGPSTAAAAATTSADTSVVEPTAATPDDASATTVVDGWTYIDDRGVTINLASRPQRIVAYIGTAAVLWDFGVRPVGVFGPQRRANGTAEPAAGNVDLDAVASAGDTWDGVNLEVLAELRPDIVVSGGTDNPWVIGTQLDLIADIAPVAVVEVYRDSASGIIANYERLAEALGADLQSAELVAARAAFDIAADDLRASAAAKPGLTVLATYADADGLYVAKPVDFPDLRQFIDLGVDVVEPTTDEEYWEMLSWEQVNTYRADLIIHDIRTFSLQPDVLAADMPTWATLPAVKAGQVAGWSAETVLSYQGFTVAMNDLADVIDRSAADIV